MNDRLTPAADDRVINAASNVFEQGLAPIILYSKNRRGEAVIHSIVNNRQASI